MGGRNAAHFFFENKMKKKVTYLLKDFDEMMKLILIHTKSFKTQVELMKNKQEIIDEIQKMSINLERGIFNHCLTLYKKAELNETWNTIFKNIYINRAILVYNNLNPNSSLQNKDLLNKLIYKQYDEFQIASFSSEQLFPERWSELKKQISKDDEDVIYTVNIEDRPDGLFKCRKCNSYKTEYNERQTRSADEPTTKFCYCYNCGNRWRFC